MERPAVFPELLQRVLVAQRNELARLLGSKIQHTAKASQTGIRNDCD
jgi:hypothetical protein